MHENIEEILSNPDIVYVEATCKLCLDVADLLGELTSWQWVKMMTGRHNSRNRAGCGAGVNTLHIGHCACITSLAVF